MSLGLPGSDRTPDDPANVLRSSYARRDEPLRGQSVANRPRPAYDPVPVPVGAFQLFPGLEIGEYYDSNIYASGTDAKDDLITVLVPTAALISNWGRHEVQVRGTGAGYYHKQYQDENSINGEIEVEGRYDLTYQTWLEASAGYSAQTERRGSPSSPGSAAEPVRYYTDRVGLGAYRGAGRLRAGINYDRVGYKFEDPDRSGGGTIDLSARDRTDHVIGAEMNYRLNTDNFVPFLRAGYTIQDYDSNPVRDSTGYKVAVGSRNDFGIIRTSAYVGYTKKMNDDMRNGDFGTVDFGGNLLWNVTGLTSVTASLQRYLGETTVGGLTNPDGASAAVTTKGEVSVMHELRRYLLVAAHLRKEWRSTRGGTVERRDDETMDIGAGARYLLNRNLYGDMTYNYTRKESDVPTADYDKHSVLVRVGIQY